MLIARIGHYGRCPDPFFVERDARVNLSSKILKSVAFIGIKKGGKFQPRATAFFVRYSQDQHSFDHLITAEHVIAGLLTKGHDIWLRVNLANGEGSEVRFDDPSAFRYHPNEDERTDVAVCPFDRHALTSETGETVVADIISLVLDEGENGFVPTDDFAKESIGLGSEIAIVGLFRSHFGKNRNIPIVRVGNISALPGEPVFTDYAGYISAYLVEARSIAGLSGSPVFALPETSGMVAKALRKGYLGQGAALLGLMHGHFDVQNLNEDVVADAESSRSIHTGIGVVVPVSKILETINHPELVAMRKSVVAELRKKEGATADVVSDDNAPPANDVNPNHREEFRRLVNAAARKPVPKD